MKQYPHKYDSVLKLINLPRIRHLNPNNQRIFQDDRINQQDNQLVSKQLKEGRKYILTTIQKQTQIFDDVNYQFRFPTSIFPDKSSGQARLSLVQKNQMENIYEDIFGEKLNEQQLYQIRLKGQFEVRSQNQRVKLPNTWRINDWLVRGRFNITKVWQDGLGTCYQFLTYSWSYFIATVPQNVLKILKLPLKLIDILVGLKSIEKVYTPDYHREVIKDFWSDIMQNELNNLNKIIGKDFLQLLYMKFDYKLQLNDLQNRRQSQAVKKQQKINLLKQGLRKIQFDFNKSWDKIKRNVLQSIQRQNANLQPNSQSIQNKFNEQKFKNYIGHVRSNLPLLNSMTYNSIEAFITLIFILSFINEKIGEKQQALSKIYEKTRQNIQKIHPIRSKQSQFLQKNVKEEYEIQKSKYQQVFYNQLFNDPRIAKLFNNTYQSIYHKYVKFRQFYPTLIEQKKKILMCLYQPTRIFTSTHLLLPPYQTLISNSSNKPYYSLKKQQKLTSDTSHHFWKCSLYWMRLTTWTLNWIIALIGSAWVGPLGLRCLCGTSSFEYDYNCDSQTGVKIPLLRETVLVKFQNVLQSMKKSRDNFESQPDLGLMGKNFSRICNIIECYFFRLFLVGVIITLTLYPIAILLFSLLSFVLVLTFWFWIPVAMVACYLFNILIFQFEISNYKNECIIRSVPLLSVAFKLLFYMLDILYSIVLLLIIAPLFCILYTLFLIVQRFLRVMMDNLMICIIALLGRTPSINTVLATKISGPGMSSNFYNKMSENKVYMLVESWLQKIFVQKFILLTREKILQQSIKYRASLRYLLQPFGHSQANLNYQRNKVQKSTNQVLQKFNERAQYFKQRYPVSPYNVRFNRMELNKYFQNSIKIVKNYVEKQHIQGWIFEENNITNRDYQELTRFLWRQVFNSGDQIFEPVQQFDERIVLDGNITSNAKQFNRNLQFIKGTLRGQANNLVQQLNIQRRQVSILEKDRQMNLVAKICEFHQKNSCKNIFLDIQNPGCLFIPPRNLDQLKNYDKENKFTQKNDHKLIELDH